MMQDPLVGTTEALILASKRIDRMHGIPTPELCMSSALAQATYALAQEQRTANMIVWSNAGNGTQDLRRDIQRRLGL